MVIIEQIGQEMWQGFWVKEFSDKKYTEQWAKSDCDNVVVVLTG